MSAQKVKTEMQVEAGCRTSVGVCTVSTAAAPRSGDVCVSSQVGLTLSVTAFERRTGSRAST